MSVGTDEPYAATTCTGPCKRRAADLQVLQACWQLVQGKASGSPGLEIHGSIGGVHHDGTLGQDLEQLGLHHSANLSLHSSSSECILEENVC